MKERIQERMKRVFNLDAISDDISQQNCEKWDSMNHLNLIIELEEEFDVSFEPEEIAKMKDFAVIKQMIQQKKI